MRVHTKFGEFPLVPRGLQLLWLDGRAVKVSRIAMIALSGILTVSPLAACVFLGALNLQAQQRRVFRGEITAGDATGRYALSNDENKMPYRLDDQANAAAFLGKRVLVVGALDETTDTILVSYMMAALPTAVMKAVLVNVDCYDCPGEMAAAKKAGLRAIGNWKRFYLAPDPRRADLIFLFSAAPYPGDYLTRDRPPARPVPVKVTYLNVIDPRTGQSLWVDSRPWGSFFVGAAASDLISQFRAQVDAQEGRVASLLAFDADQHRKAPPNLGK